MAQMTTLLGLLLVVGFLSDLCKKSSLSLLFGAWLFVDKPRAVVRQRNKEAQQPKILSACFILEITPKACRCHAHFGRVECAQQP
jgi:hypothetical protein